MENDKMIRYFKGIKRLNDRITKATLIRDSREQQCITACEFPDYKAFCHAYLKWERESIAS